MASSGEASPHLPWTVKCAISILSFAINSSRRDNLTVNRRLMSLFDVKSSPSDKPVNGVISSDVAVDPTRSLWFRIYSPSTVDDEAAGLPIIIYFHGGGFAFLSPSSKHYNDMCKRWARELPAVVISVNYRLSPEHRYPCQYEDGFDVLNFIDKSFVEMEGFPAFADPTRCFVGGDSAGANIAHHVAVKAHDYEFKNVNIKGLLSLQPFFAGEERTESEIRLAKAPLLSLDLTDWMWKAFLPNGSDRDHPAANIFGPDSADLTKVKYPATIVIAGGFDLLQDRQKKYFETLKECGKEAQMVEYPNAIHAFYLFPELPESSLLIDEFRSFIHKQLST